MNLRRLSFAAVAFLAVPPIASADGYTRQPGIDVIGYRFRITLSDVAEDVEGEAAVDVRFAAPGQSRFWLDLASPIGPRGMTVSGVTSGGVPVPFSHQADRLQMAVEPPPAVGDRREFIVRYRGTPAGGLRTVRNRYGVRMMFAENWPDQARQWLPTVDHPSDKATSEFIVTAPAGQRVVAGGRLRTSTQLPDGRTVSHWVQDHPIPAWQNVIAAGPLTEVSGADAQGVPVYAWVYPEDAARAAPLINDTRRALEFFTGFVGPFPYRKLGSVQAVMSFGGMENAGSIFYSEAMFDGRDLAPLVAHEVAHQWFGDSITERDWDDVWLSEGFATYFALLFIEHDRGRGAFLGGLNQSRSRILGAEQADPQATVVHANITDLRRLIGPLVYEKGAWTLHMLRGVVGDKTFREGVRRYFDQYRDRNATTDDFRNTVERVHGSDLSWFFDQWLKRPGTPAVSGGWSYDATAKRVRIDLVQSQPGKPFRLPLELRLDGPGLTGGSVMKVEMIEKSQSFESASDVAPTSLAVDPNHWVLLHTSPANPSLSTAPVLAAPPAPPAVPTGTPPRSGRGARRRLPAGYLEPSR